jgi:NAD(P)-dependent dehydrogenase (short-subunit alcohol dehydrogenase family)
LDSRYGLSKALLAVYTMVVAKEHPELSVNACTPGFIETDMTRHFAAKADTTPTAMGMKEVHAGAASPVYLAFDDIPTPKGEGWFFGSDKIRSPLHKYRSPGDPPFDGIVDL